MGGGCEDVARTKPRRRLVGIRSLGLFCGNHAEDNLGRYGEVGEEVLVEPVQMPGLAIEHTIGKVGTRRAEPYLLLVHVANSAYQPTRLGDSVIHSRHQAPEIQMQHRLRR